MNLRDDELLNIIKYMDIDDIHSLCEVNKSLKELCKTYKDIIYKNVIYAIEYIEHIINDNDSNKLKSAIVAVYNNKNDAIMRFDLLFNDKQSELMLKHEIDKNYTFSLIEDSQHVRKLKDSDGKTFIWKIIAKRVF